AKTPLIPRALFQAGVLAVRRIVGSGLRIGSERSFPVARLFACAPRLESRPRATFVQTDRRGGGCSGLWGAVGGTHSDSRSLGHGGHDTERPDEDHSDKPTG